MARGRQEEGKGEEGDETGTRVERGPETRGEEGELVGLVLQSSTTDTTVPHTPAHTRVVLAPPALPVVETFVTLAHPPDIILISTNTSPPLMRRPAVVIVRA